MPKAALLSSTKAPTAPEQDQKPDRHGFRGCPPPIVGLSLSSLADDTLLTTYEVAAIARLSTNSLDAWRRQKDHPLRWVAIIDGRIRYRAGDVKAFLAGGEPRRFTTNERKPPSDYKPKPARKPSRRRADRTDAALQEQS